METLTPRQGVQELDSTLSGRIAKRAGTALAQPLAPDAGRRPLRQEITPKNIFMIADRGR
jgi:ATP-dependent protease HslVU (ClpYQ) ATPase subunit